MAKSVRTSKSHVKVSLCDVLTAESTSDGAGKLPQLVNVNKTVLVFSSQDGLRDLLCWNSCATLRESFGGATGHKPLQQS